VLSLGRAANYDEMLTRIAIGTIVISSLAIWWMRSAIPSLDVYLASIDKMPAVGPFKDYDKLPVGTILPGIVIGVLFRVVKLHDRVSDLFGVRRRFDISEILIPICGQLDKKLTFERRDQLAQERHQWMDRLFYAYASKLTRAAAKSA